MVKTLSNRFALSTKGAKDLINGIFFTTLLNFSLMMPVTYLAKFLNDYFKQNEYSALSFKKNFASYTILSITAMLVMFIIAVWQYRSTFSAVYEESAERRIALAEKLRILPLAFFGEKDISDLTSTIMSDNTDLEHVFSHAVPQLFASVISVVCIAVALSFYKWQLAVALFWVVPFATFIIVYSKKTQIKNNQNIYDSKKIISEKIQEGLETMQEMKAYNMSSTYIHDLNSKLDNYEEDLIKGELKTGVLVNISQAILKLGLASVIIVGGKMFLAGDITLFTYIIFLIVSSRVYEPINQTYNNLATLFYLDIRINRMNNLQKMPIQKGETEFNPEKFDIEFKNVHFSYDDKIKVLEGISFTAKQGEVTALVGPSGGGKSTTAKLAARFWDIDSGEILLDGVNITKINPEVLLKHYSIVFQDVVLFNTSIMENIRIGNRYATDKEVIQVAKIARCDDFVLKMPHGYNSVIGENGETLSGGERQRISIARAILKNAPIVLLDEATASLDVENESKIQAGLSELIKDKTVIIIAHRMRTVANVDKVVVLKNGKIAEIGTPSQLADFSGIFAKMMERQVGLY